MSALDTMAPFISSPWRDRDGRPMSVRPLPGLRSEVLRELSSTYPGLFGPGPSPRRWEHVLCA